MALLKCVGGWLAIGCLSGCLGSTDPAPYTQENVAVHAVLNAGASTASLLLTRFHPERAEFQPITDAQVVLHEGGNRLFLLPSTGQEAPCVTSRLDAARELGRGCYAARVLPHGIMPGSRWSLEVTFGGGRRITGSAAVPPPPILHEPMPGARINVRNQGRPLMESGTSFLQPLASIPLRWSSAAEIGRVEVLMTAVTRFRGGRAFQDGGCEISHTPNSRQDVTILRDGGTLHLFGVQCPENGVGGASAAQPWDSIAASLSLTAFDTTYARYARGVHQGTSGYGRSIRTDHAAAGVSGAIGVFAGAASTSLPVMLIPLRE